MLNVVCCHNENTPITLLISARHSTMWDIQDSLLLVPKLKEGQT